MGALIGQTACVGLVGWVMLCGAPALVLALPTGRHYEMVSPVYKGGYGVNEVTAVAPGGERAVFASLGSLAGAPGDAELFGDYVATRGAAGWTTSTAVLPGAIAPQISSVDYSPSLETELAFGFLGPNAGQAAEHGEAREAEFLTHGTNLADTVSSWNLAGPVLTPAQAPRLILVYRGASPDLCHIVFFFQEDFAGVAGQLDDLDRGCDGTEPSVSPLSVNNANTALSSKCRPAIGTTDANYEQGAETGSAFNAVAADGAAIFFTDCVEGGAGHQVFVRLGGTRTVEVSRPVDATKPFGGCGGAGEVPCPGGAARASAQFMGASETGSVVFLTTSAPLAGGAKDTVNDLYLARIGCPDGGSECEPGEREVLSQELVSRDPTPGEEAEVQGVIRVAPDGSRVYFVARGKLTGAPNSQGSTAVDGADNLYVYDASTRVTAFVAALCSGPGSSGAQADPRCPGASANDETLWTNSKGGEAQTADASGRYLVFSSFGQLTGDDTDSARDVFRFDAVSGVLQRVSAGEAGHDANGNNSSFDASISPGRLTALLTEHYEMASRAISEDGSRIVFKTAEPLSPSAGNGVQDIYEWHLGADGAAHVSLISGAGAVEGDVAPVITPSGNDIFFVTTQGLVPQDVDGAADLYDARIGPGFPPAPAPRQPCSGDACQGPLTSPLPLLVPGSASQVPAATPPAPASAGAGTKATAVPGAKAKKQKKKRHSKRRRIVKGSSAGGRS